MSLHLRPETTRHWTNKSYNNQYLCITADRSWLWCGALCEWVLSLSLSVCTSGGTVASFRSRLCVRPCVLVWWNWTLNLQFKFLKNEIIKYPVFCILYPCGTQCFPCCMACWMWWDTKSCCMKSNPCPGFKHKLVSAFVLVLPEFDPFCGMTETSSFCGEDCMLCFGCWWWLTVGEVYWKEPLFRCRFLTKMLVN